MTYSFLDLAWLFIIYTFLGWCSEVGFAALTSGKFVNRGMANGPICPIYGFGMIIILLVLTPIREQTVLLFLGAVLLTSLLEFLTGYVLEKLFHDKWWDYSEEPFNIGGYVCLRFSILWGLAGLLIVDVVNPPIYHLVTKLQRPWGLAILAVLYAMLLADEIVTFVHLLKLPRRIRALDEIQLRLRQLSDGIGGVVADKVLDVVEKGQELQQSNLMQELSEKRSELQDAGSQKLEQLREMNDARKERRDAEQQEEQAALEARRAELLTKVSFVQARLVKAYPRLGRGQHKEAFQDIAAAYRQKRAERKQKKQ